jgi:hypothetical protein
MEVVVFLMGWAFGHIVARFYYAFSTTHWGSWDWFKGNRLWLWVHRGLCHICPRKHYCLKWKEMK